MANWKRRLSAVSWPVAEQFASPLMQLVLTPVLLHRVAAEEFALWVLAQSLVVAAPAWSLGRSTALLMTVPRLPEPDRAAHTSRLIGQTLRLIVLLAAIAAALVALLGEVLLGFWPLAADARGFIIVTILFLAVTEAENCIGAAMKSYRAFDESAKIELAGRALQLSFMVWIVDSSSSASELLAIAMASGLLKLLVKVLALRRRQVLRVTPEWSRDTPEALTQFKQFGFWSLVQVLSGIAFYSFDRWVVGYYMGSTALSAYFVCNQLAQLAHAVPAAASQLLIQWSAARRELLPDAQQGRHMLNVAVLGSVMAALPSLGVLALGPQVLSLWISPSFSAEHSLLLRHLAVVFLLLALNIPSYAMLAGLGHARWTAVVSVMAGLVYMASTLLVKPAEPVLMADLKLIYALLSLALIIKLLRVLKTLGKA